MTGHILQATGLTAGYGTEPVIRELDLVVGRGELVVLLGRNGAGKSTTLNALAGPLKPVAGDVLLDGAPVRDALHRRARRGLTFIPERRAIVRRLTVSENLRLGRADTGAAFEMFPELHRLSRRPAGLLSGGEQQMLVLARALAAKPKVLLIDELSMGLAPLIVRRLLTTLRSIAQQQGTGVLLVEQHVHSALAAADRGYVLSGGRIQLSGTAENLLGRLPEIEEAYLGA